MRLDSSADLGRIIREGRRRRGWSQQRLATRAGVHREWVIRVENDSPRAEVHLVLRVLAVLGLLVNVEQRPVPDDPLFETDGEAW